MRPKQKLEMHQEWLNLLIEQEVIVGSETVNGGKEMMENVELKV